MTVTYKNLYTQVVKEIENRVPYVSISKYYNQTGRGGLMPMTMGNASSLVDVSVSEVMNATQLMLQTAIPPRILEGLEVRATNPATTYVTVSAGSGTVGGAVYTLAENTAIEIPLFQGLSDVYYVNLFKDTVRIDTQQDSGKLPLAKVIVPAKDKAVRVIDNKDDSWDAYIVNLIPINLYQDGRGNFEEDSLQLLRNNMKDILADSIIGNLTLSENLKITNTAGTLIMDSSSIKLNNPVSETTMAKFNRYGTFFYDDSGIEIAKFSTGGARIGNIVINPNSIQSGNFASGALGSGFQILDNGNAEFQNIRARGKISTSVFEKDTISVVGGSVLVMGGDVLAQDMTSSDSSKLIISGDDTFAIGDMLRIKDGENDEWFEVTDAIGTTYTVTRDKDFQYDSNDNPAWKKGTSVVNFGASGDGGIYMTSSESNAPYLSVVTHEGAPWTTLTNHLRLGNLNGFLGYSSDLYGIAIGTSDEYMKYDTTGGLQIKGSITVTGGTATRTYYQDDAPSGIGEKDGDIWIDTDNNKRMYTRIGGSWFLTGDTGGSGMAVYYQDNEPDSGYVLNDGDFWIDTNDSNTLYIYSSETPAGWRSIGEITGINVYRQDGQPTGQTAGDLWIDTDDSDKLYRFNGTIWQLIGVRGLDDDGNVISSVRPGSNIGTPAGAGLFLGADYLGYYSGSAWDVFIDNTGDFQFKGDANNYIAWNGVTLTIKGLVQFQSSSTGYANLSDKPSSLTDINSTEGNKLSGVEDGATVGATWNTNIIGEPTSLLDISFAEYTAYNKAYAWHHTSNDTLIDGAKIYTGTVTANQIAANTITANQIAAGTITLNELNFMPIPGNEVIATINASTEELLISAEKLHISGSTTFEAGYNPSDKLNNVGGAYTTTATGARLEIFPNANIGLIAYDANSGEVFKVVVGGTDVGDVVFGSEASGSYIKWDKSADKLIADSIQSSNYVPGTTGWIIGNTGMEVNQGTIDLRAVRDLELQMMAIDMMNIFGTI